MIDWFIARFLHWCIDAVILSHWLTALGSLTHWASTNWFIEPCVGIDWLIDWVCFRLFSEPVHRWHNALVEHCGSETTRNEAMDQWIRIHEAMHQSLSMSESVDRWITMSMKRDSMYQRIAESELANPIDRWSNKAMNQNQRANRSIWSNGATSMDRWFMHECLYIICYMNQRSVNELMCQVIQDWMRQCIKTNCAIHRSATAP